MIPSQFTECLKIPGGGRYPKWSRDDQTTLAAIVKTLKAAEMEAAKAGFIPTILTLPLLAIAHYPEGSDMRRRWITHVQALLYHMWRAPALRDGRGNSQHAASFFLYEMTSNGRFYPGSVNDAPVPPALLLISPDLLKSGESGSSWARHPSNPVKDSPAVFEEWQVVSLYLVLVLIWPGNALSIATHEKRWCLRALDGHSEKTLQQLLPWAFSFQPALRYLPGCRHCNATALVLGLSNKLMSRRLDMRSLEWSHMPDWALSMVAQNLDYYDILKRLCSLVDADWYHFNSWNVNEQALGLLERQNNVPWDEFEIRTPAVRVRVGSQLATESDHAQVYGNSMPLIVPQPSVEEQQQLPAGSTSTSS